MFLTKVCINVPSTHITCKANLQLAALRMYPPVPLNVRTALKDTTLPVGGGANGLSPIFITKGTSVIYSVWAMHRRPDIWGQDASKFRPERWEGSNLRGWQYLPFNGGPRICLGREYLSPSAII